MIFLVGVEDSQIKMEQYFIAIDFETAGGDHRKNGFIELGASLWNLTKCQKVSEFSMFSNMEGFTWDERCLNEFWLKNKENYERCLKGMKESRYNCFQVVQFFKEWVLEVTKDKPNVYFIGDCVNFDYAILRFFYDGDFSYILGRYTEVFSMDSFFYAFSGRVISNGLLDESSKETFKTAFRNRTSIDYWENSPFKHTHAALDDANYMAWFWCQSQKCIALNFIQ